MLEFWYEKYNYFYINREQQLHTGKKQVREINDQGEETCQKTLEMELLRRTEENILIYLLSKVEYKSMYVRKY